MGMSWFFFGSGHGKGEHDGAGVVVKRTLTHEQLKPNGAILRCAADVVAFCQANLSQGAPASYPSKERECARVFWEVLAGDVNREVKWNCSPLSQNLALCTLFVVTTRRIQLPWQLETWHASVMHAFMEGGITASIKLMWRPRSIIFLSHYLMRWRQIPIQ